MKQPFICFFGGIFSNAEKAEIAETTTPFFYHSDIDVEQAIKTTHPHVLVSIGNASSDFPYLMKLPYSERRRWLHYKSPQEVIQKLWNIYYCFVSYAINSHNDPDLITCFSSSYKSGEYIKRPFNTLLNQTYQHWEWVIFDDSDGDENFQNLIKLREEDPRIRIYRAEKNSGSIGHMKNLASSLGRGACLVELDHDDELTPKSLEYCMKAMKQYPDAGFFFSDFCEINESGTNFTYGDMFALGYGSYRKEWNEDRRMWINICNSPPVTPITVRYLVGCPNHYRAWRTSTLKEMGGWNPTFHVADDYEIMVRSFLKTKSVRIPYNSYFQYRNNGGNNHTFIRNKEIQKLWKTISRFYNQKIHERLVELNVEDKYYPNWEDWRQFTRCWNNPVYEKWLHTVMPIRGTDTNPLVSVVIASEENANLVKHALAKILNQSYSPLEIIIVGDKCSQLDRMIEGLVIEIEKEYYEQSDYQDSSNFKPSMDLNRLKQDVKWWNLAQAPSQKEPKMGWSSAINYACKMIAQGSLVLEFDLRDPMNLNKFDAIHQNQFIEKSVSLLMQDPELQYVKLRETNLTVHRTKLFEKYGYWWSDKNLHQIWNDNQEKYQEI